MIFFWGNYDMLHASKSSSCFSLPPPPRLFHSFKLVSERFAFGVNPPKVDEFPPLPRGLRASSFLPFFGGISSFEVCWSFACIKSLGWNPWRIALAFFFSWMGHSHSIPVCFALTGRDYLVSFELHVFLSNILDICCLTPMFVLRSVHLR